MKLLNITFIESDTLNIMKTCPAAVHSIFKNTLNITVAETLITISSVATKQKNTILIKENIDFSKLNINIQDDFMFDNDTLKCSDTTFIIPKESIHSFLPYTKTYTLNHHHLKALDRLKYWMNHQTKIHLGHYDQKDKMLRYQFEKIDTFLKSRTMSDAINILGLGVGLTPIGDDILFGYLLATQSIEMQALDEETLLHYAKKQTNIISYQFLEDLIHRHYSDFYRNLLEEFFLHYKITKAKELINFGETSGLAILTGFLYGLQKRSV